MLTKTKLHVGLLPVMAVLYDTLFRDIRPKSQAFIEKISHEMSGNSLEIHSASIVSTEEEIRKAYNQFSNSGVDVLVVTHVAYCPSGQIFEALLDNDLPIVLWAAQPVAEIVPEKFDIDSLLLSHGVHGTQDLANILRRRGKAFGALHGHWQQESTAEQLMHWAQAGHFLFKMKKSNPVVLGGHFEDMLDLQLNEDDFIKEFGVEAKYVSNQRFSELAGEVDDREIHRKIENYRSIFKWDKKLSESLVIKTARHELALRKLIANYESSAVGINFVTLCEESQIADALHVAASSLMTEGVGYGGEGDWVTAMLVHGLQAATEGASFSEIFSVGYHDNRLLLRHWGEGNYLLSRQQPVLRGSKYADRAEFAVIDFEFESGVATLVNLTADANGKGQITSIAGSIEDDHLPVLDGPRGLFKPKNSDVTELLDQYAGFGCSHHLTLVKNDCSKLLDLAAKLTGWRHIPL